MERYVLTDERDPPLVFHGRESIRNRISKLIKKVQAEATRDVPGSRTHVITGVPGAGKTSLLKKLKEENEDEAHFIMLQGKALLTRERFLERVGQSIDLPEDELTSVYQTQTQTVDAGVNKVFSFLRKRTDTGPPRIDREGSHWTILEEMLKKKYERDTPKPVVLCIDEAQNIDTESEFTQYLIGDVHALDTHRLHVITIFAGLTNTPSQLFAAGLSRFSIDSLYTIGNLSDLESQQVITDILQHEQFGLSGKFLPDQLPRTAKLLSIVSEQWPRHLHHYIKGFMRELHDTYETDPQAQSVDIMKILDIGNRSRVEYYAFLNANQSEEVKKFNINILGKLLLKKDTFTKSEMLNLGKEASYFGDEKVLLDTFAECCKRGFVQEVHHDSDEYSVPIPSLGTYLTRQSNRFQLTLESLQESQSKELSKLFDR